MLFAVTGATGCVGRAFVSRAMTEGHTVRPLTGPGSWGGPLVPPALLVPLEATALEPHVDGTDGVVHLAARVHVRGREAGELGEFRRTNVDGTLEVLRACEKAGVRRLVFASTVGVYSRKQGKVVDDDPLDPAEPYLISKLEAERLLQREAKTTHVVILRLCVVSGAGDRGNIRRLIHAIDRRRFFLVGDGSNRKTMLSSLNAADLLLRAATSSPGLGAGPWIASDPDTLTMRQIAFRIADMLGRRPPPRVPARLALTAGRLADRLSELAGRPAAVGSMLAKLAESTEFTGDRLFAALGGPPPVSAAEGLRLAVGDYRAS